MTGMTNRQTGSKDNNTDSPLVIASPPGREEGSRQALICRGGTDMSLPPLHKCAVAVGLGRHHMLILSVFVKLFCGGRGHEQRSRAWGLSSNFGIECMKNRPCPLRSPNGRPRLPARARSRSRLTASNQTGMRDSKCLRISLFVACCLVIWLIFQNASAPKA